MSGKKPATPPAAGAPQRKFRRRGMGSIVRDGMGTMGALAALKAEADNIKSAGVMHVLQHEDNLTPLLHTYLSGTAAVTHNDESGVEYEELNRKQYAAPPHTIYEGSKTGTHGVQLDKEVALNLFITLVQALKTTTVDDDGSPKLCLDGPEGMATMLRGTGGFQKLYESINVPPPAVSKPEQDRCIFAMSHAQFMKLGGPPAKKLSELLTRKITSLYSFNISCKVVHILFHWNQHSFFTYHQDEDGEIAAIVNLSHGSAAMHVAGLDEAVYDGIGSTHIFPTKVFHRSGNATRRSVKVAFFFNTTTTTITIEEGSGGPSSSGDAPTMPAAPVEATNDTNGESEIKAE